SPMVVGADVVMGFDINLLATENPAPGDNLTVNAGVTVRSVVGSITLCAGDNVVLQVGSTVDAFGSVLIKGDFGDLDPGVGADIFIGGRVNNGGTGTVLGGGDNDRITVLQKGSGDMTLDGRGGDDFYFVQVGNLLGHIRIDDTGGGIDTAVV